MVLLYVTLIIFTLCHLSTTYNEVHTSHIPRKHIRYNSLLGVKSIIKGPNACVRNFERFRLTSDEFVDKSRLIEDICLMESGTVIMLTRPGGWGKSLNMDMVERFVEITIHRNGTILPARNSRSYKLFTGGELTFDNGRRKVLRPLEISKNKDIMSRFFGKYPAIYFDFDEVYGFKTKHVVDILTQKVQLLFHYHVYLRGHASGEDKEILERYMTGNISTSDIEQSLKFLSHRLFEFFGEKVFIFIEDYDFPYSELNDDFNYTAHSTEEEFAKTTGILRRFYEHTFTNNEYLEKGLVNGILPVAKDELFPGLKKLKMLTILDTELSRYYGLSDKEVETLLEACNLGVVHDQIKNHYRGYHYGGKVLYNPYTIANCISEGGEISNYWLDWNMDSLDLLQDVFLVDDMQAGVRRLVQGEEVLVKINKEIPALHAKDKKELFYDILVFYGYLNAVPVNVPGDGRYNLSIPNREIEGVYIQRLKKWICKKLNISDYDRLSRHLFEAEIDDFGAKFQGYLMGKTGLELRTEADLLEIMSGVLYPLSPFYIIEVIAKPADGLHKHHLVPRRKGKVKAAIAINYRGATTSDALEKVAELALGKVDEDTDYIKQINGTGYIKYIIKIGVGFYKKEVCFKHEVDTLNENLIFSTN